MSLRSLTSLAIGALLAAVLGLRVYTDFEPSRAILVRAPVAAAGGILELDVPDTETAAALEPPFALIARVDAGEASASYRFELDGSRICDRPVAGGGPVRIDCVVAPPASPVARTLRITGPATGWTLHYLELASHHGSSTGLFKAFVLPREKKATRVSAVAAVAAGLAVAALFLLPGAAVPGSRARGAHVAVSGVVVGALVLVLAAPWISPFNIVIAPRTWALCALVLAGPRLFVVARRIFGAASPRLRRTGVAALVTFVAAAAGAHVVRQAAATYYGGNISGLVQIAESRFNANPALRHRDDLRASLVLHQGTGYDAQFMYFAAFDPWLRELPNVENYRGFIDAPPYRYPRSGFVWLTKLVSLGDEGRYPAAMVWLGIAGFAATAAALSAIALQNGGSPLWGLAVFGIPGLWRPLMLAMPEPVSAALATLAVLCLLHDRTRWAAACFAAAILVRETTALVLLVAVVFVWKAGRGRDAIALLLALVPYAAWRLYVGWMLFPDWGMQGFFFNPHAYDLPIKPLVELFGIGAPHPDPGVARASYWFAGLLVIAAGTAFALARHRAQVVTIAAAVYGVMALALDRDIIWTHVSNLERTTYELFLMLAIAGALSSSRPRREAWGLAALFAAGAVYVLLLGNDAPFMRRTLLGL